MAAEIKPVTSSYLARCITLERPNLLARIDSTGESINGVKLLDGGKTILSICDDKTFRIWQKRDSGQYWPSVCHSLPSIPSCLYYSVENRKLFLGLESGTIMELDVADDWNSITTVREYLSHQLQVMDLLYDQCNNWVLSVGKDKFFVYHSSETGVRLGGYQSTAWCTCITYDSLSKHAFIGCYNGHVIMLKLEQNTYQLVTTLKGHEGSVRCLAWDSDSDRLFSGSYDQAVIVWDVGGNQGTAYELRGHKSKVTSLKYLKTNKILVSAGEDAMITFWNMNLSRYPTPEWLESNSCQLCCRPFFWNIKAMVDQKQIGIRQHHCRKCGKAICDSCSSKRSNIPAFGFEFEVRVCDACFKDITDDDRISMAKFQEVKHSVQNLDVDELSQSLLTAGSDCVMKIWNISEILNNLPK